MAQTPKTFDIDPRMAVAAQEAFENLRHLVMETLGELGVATSAEVASFLEIPEVVVTSIYQDSYDDGITLKLSGDRWQLPPDAEN